MNNYNYFISYSVNYSKLGQIIQYFGNCDVGYYKEIENINDIILIQEKLEKKTNLPKKSVIIINYKLFN